MIGLIGDVHCEHESLELAIKTLRDESIETIICTGDLPTGPGDINRCCELIRSHKILTVRGNHERWLLDRTLTGLPHATPPSVVSDPSWRLMESLPVTIDLPTSAGLALICHGIGHEDMLSILPEQSDVALDENPFLFELVRTGKYRWMINGHSHHRMVRKHGSLTIINAGALRRDHDPCFAAVDLDRGRVQFWNIENRKTANRTASIALP